MVATAQAASDVAPRPETLIPAWLLEETHGVQYSPVCPMPFMVRLIGYRRGRLDLLPYVAPTETKDAFGFGKTMEEAANNAVKMREQQKADYETKKG